MKNRMLLLVSVAALLLTAACSSASNTNTAAPATSNTANRPAAPANTAANNTAPANTASAPGASEGKQDFTLVNETGVEIHSLYVSPHDSDDWEEDILGRDTLPSGESVHITFNRDEKAAQWDLRVQDKGGNAIEWENLNLLEISKVTLHYKDGKATAQVE